MSKQTAKTNAAQQAPKIIGAETVYTGTAHTWATGLKVRITAVHKHHFRPGANLDDARECPVLNDDESIARHGGIGPHDLIEFAPWVKEQGRFSFVHSDARVSDIALFAHVKN